MNIASNLEASSYYFPQQPALSEAGSEITYGALNERVNCIATGLIKMGIRPGEHVVSAPQTRLIGLRSILGSLKQVLWRSHTPAS